MNTSGKVVMAAIVTVSNKQKSELSKIKLWRKDLMEEKKLKLLTNMLKQYLVLLRFSTGLG